MDAVLVGIGTVLADNPSLTVRSGRVGENILAIRRIVLDGAARTPLTSRVVTDAWRSRTIVVVGPRAPRARKQALGKRVTIWTAPERRGGIDLRWLIRRLGKTGVTSLLVEGGGEIIASFLSAGLVHRANFFIAPKILGGRGSRKAVAGNGAGRRADITRFSDVRWRRCGEDLLLSGGIGNSAS
jgi:diaminohydroxyphosphoribosylaminopyrimidine deaminase/5-amino-6-(5-phosphoribosylamino)uracil reductase